MRRQRPKSRVASTRAVFDPHNTKPRPNVRSSGAAKFRAYLVVFGLFQKLFQSSFLSGVVSSNFI